MSDAMPTPCPAATGVARPGCESFSDEAHRCKLDSEHVLDQSKPVSVRIAHECRCEYTWTSTAGTIDEFLKTMMPPRVRLTLTIRDGTVVGREVTEDLAETAE